MKNNDWLKQSHEMKSDNIAFVPKYTIGFLYKSSLPDLSKTNLSVNIGNILCEPMTSCQVPS